MLLDIQKSNNMKNIFKQNKGIGLIEIILSISILSVGILGIISAFPRATAIQRSLELNTIANHLAQETMESYNAIAYEDIAVGVLENNLAIDTDTSSPFFPFAKTTIVDLLDSNLAVTQTDTGLKQITTTISWSHPLDGSTGSTTLFRVLNKR
jgi:type II secretory pathway pseudopilin PulG